jgi:hypothetical protein
MDEKSNKRGAKVAIPSMLIAQGESSAKVIFLKP